MTNELIAIFSMGVTILGSVGFVWRSLHREIQALGMRVSALEQRVARIEGWLEGWRTPYPEGGEPAAS